MSSQSDDLYDRAVAMLANRHYEDAGDALARGGWLLLANPRFDNSPFDDDEKGWVGKGIERLVTSAICYRVAGRSDRAAHRGTEASAVAADFQTVCTRPVQQACLQEMRADAIVAVISMVQPSCIETQRAHMKKRENRSMTRSIGVQRRCLGRLQHHSNRSRVARQTEKLRFRGKPSTDLTQGTPDSFWHIEQRSNSSGLRRFLRPLLRRDILRPHVGRQRTIVRRIVVRPVSQKM